ncbi:MAG: hypothetical protein QNJ85_02915 [Gammaproteobacteria bacterium]|nr:hypothetical protein [Gammaproteobacteria bacterium]
MSNDPLKCALLPTLLGLVLIGMNFIAERWAESRIEQEAASRIELERCSASAADASIADCSQTGSDDQPRGPSSNPDAHNFFPAELLLAGMVAVGLLAARQKSDNPYLTFVIVATLLGLTRALLAGSVFVPLVYFVLIGAGFAAGSMFFRRGQAA